MRYVSVDRVWTFMVVDERFFNTAPPWNLSIWVSCVEKSVFRENNIGKIKAYWILAAIKQFSPLARNKNIVSTGWILAFYISSGAFFAAFFAKACEAEEQFVLRVRVSAMEEAQDGPFLYQPLR